jgi:hypothetical protein
MSTAALDLKVTMTNICQRWNYKFEEISPGVFRVDVFLKQKDGSARYQFVYVWMIPGRYFGKDVVYMNSRCGEFSSNLNLYKLLKEGGYGTYSAITVTTDKRADGSPCETVIVQAVQPIEFTNEAILNEAMYDVAFNADAVESLYFGGDAN